MNYKMKNIFKIILAIVLIIIAAIVAVFGISTLTKKGEERPNGVNLTFEIGGLTEEGKYLETKKSIYTKDLFECKGLNVEPAFDSDVSYRIFFYDYNDAFVSATAKLTANYEEEVDVLVKSARIVITPNDDSSISWYEKSGYAKQLTIKVNKEQSGLPKQYNYNLANAQYNEFSINAAGSFAKASDYELTSYTIDLRNLKQFYSKIKMSVIDDAYDLVYACVCEEPVLKNAAVYTTPKIHQITDGKTTFASFEIPSDANYLIVEAINGAGGVVRDRTPNIIFFN